MRKAILINAVAKYLTVIMGIIINAVLARLLSPEDYGIVAIITVFSTFFTLFSDMGLSQAVIQMKQLKKNDIKTLFSFTVYVGIILAILFSFLGIPISLIYDDNIYRLLMPLLSISLFFNSVNIIPNGILTRDKRFITIAVRTILVYSVSGVIAILLAYCGLKYYALIAQTVFNAIIYFLWNYCACFVPFSFKINWNTIKQLKNYSGYIFSFTLVNYFSRNFDNLLTGKFIGNSQLGYYDKSYKLMLYPVSNLTGVINTVLHPILSDFQNERIVVYEKYTKVIKVLGMAGAFVAPFCFLTAPEIVRILYGQGWNESIECFRILSAAVFTQMITSSSGAIFNTIGETKLLFQSGLLCSLTSVIFISIGVFAIGNIEGVAFMVSCAYIIHFIIAYYTLVVIGFGYSFTDFLKKLLPEFIILFGLVISIILYPFTTNSYIVSFVIKSIYILLVYFILVLITGEHKELLILIKRNRK